MTLFAPEFQSTTIVELKLAVRQLAVPLPLIVNVALLIAGLLVGGRTPDERNRGAGHLCSHGEHSGQEGEEQPCRGDAANSHDVSPFRTCTTSQ
jgi:hypothetical protein